MPDWLYEDNVDRAAMIPSDPWTFPPDHFNYYVAGGKYLRDPTCETMASYAARYVGWYTAGGFTDECGVRHSSGLRYRWPLLSVLNEDEYGTPYHPPRASGLNWCNATKHPRCPGVMYTICYDAWKRALSRVSPAMQLVGPELAGGPDGLRKNRRPRPGAHPLLDAPGKPHL